MSFFSRLRTRTLTRLPRGRAQHRPAAPRFRPRIEALEDRCLLSTFLVTNTNDSGAGSFRQAILDSNATPGTNTIDFNIPGTGVQTIQPASELPSITNPVVLDATTQPGYAGTPLIELDGTNAGTATGLYISAGNSTVKGLAIDNWTIGVGLVFGSNNVIQDDYIGVAPDGNTLAADGAYGILVGAGSSNNQIEGNVVAGGLGANIFLEGSSNDTIIGNFIGTNASGTAALGGGYGVWVGDAIRSENNTIGGSVAADRNVISGNISGIFLDGGPGEPVDNNVVAGNYIGTDVTGTKAIPNTEDGVDLEQASNNVIGGTTPGSGNVISGNALSGVQFFSDSNSNSVEGNLIGTDATGTNPLGNSINGVKIISSTNTTIGGTAPGADNTIAFNGKDGVLVDDTLRQSPDSYVLTSSSLTRDGTTVLSYDAVGSLAINGGSGGNTFYVQSTPAGTSTTINAGPGGDTIDVGSTANTLDPIQGAVTVNGTGVVTLNVFDQGTSSQETYDVSATQITRAPYTPPGSPPASPTQTINYVNVGYVNVYGGLGANLWGAESTSPQTTTTSLYTQGIIDHNENEIVVENTQDVLDDIKSPLALHGTAYDYVEAYDGLNTVGHTYTLTTGMLQRDGMANITYDGIGAFIVATANNPYFGHTPNTVNVQSLGTVFAPIAVGTGDTVTVGQNGSMANILGDVRIQSVAGQVPKQITLDDSADPTARTVTLGSDTTFGYLVNGLANGSQGEGLIGLGVDPTTPVSILTGAGNDVISVHDLTNAPALALDAGGGTNTLDYSAYKGTVQAILPLGVATGFAGGIKNIENVTGGQGNCLLVGDANPNVFIGGTGRNVIIGGGGGDTLNASTATSDNILIGGTTDYDSNLAALDAIFAEWTRTDLSFRDRFSDLTTGTNGQGATPLNQVNGTLILLTSTTVHADTSPDTLIGSNQTDPATGQRVHNWFFYDFDDTLINFLSSSDHKTKVH